MTRRMADSVTPTDIPVNDPTTGRPWDLVLGYVDGHFAWSAAGWARFPNSVHVRCAVFSSTLAADVLDRENGDATAAEAVQWVKAKRARGDDPTVYVGLADWPALQAAFNAAGVAHPHYGVAAYPGAGPVQQTLNGITSVFHQFTDTPGGHWDESVVVDSWMNSGFRPATTPLKEAPDMYAVVNPTGGWIHLRFGTGHMADQETQDQNIFKNAGILVTYPNQAQWDILWAQAQRWETIQANQANPQAVHVDTLNVTSPTHYRATDQGDGVTDIVAV